MMNAADDNTPRAFVIRAAALVILAVTVAACSRAEPRWLIRLMPGDYPEVVYFVPTDTQAVAITIDDGPSVQTTERILDVLAEQDAKATFFLTTNNVAGNEELVRRMLDEGHELAHHMTEDEVSVRLSDAEFAEKFDAAAAVIDEYGGSQWFRPGSGRYNAAMRKRALDGGYRLAMASSPPIDTLVYRPGWVSDYFRRMVEPGSIIVMHDGGERGRRTAQALELLLPKLRAHGYVFMTLSELDATAVR